jgi:hypothetical protein
MQRYLAPAALLLALPASIGWADVALAPAMAPNAANAVLPPARVNQHVGAYVTPEDYGAYGDDSRDDTAAINAALAAVASSSEYTLKLLHNVYKVTSDIVIDIGAFSNNLQSDGLKILVPDGGADLDGASITATPTLEIRCTGVANGCDNLVIGGGRLTVKGSNASGPVFVLGKSDLSDSFVAPTIDYLVAQNGASASGAMGAQVNVVAAGKLRFLIPYSAAGGSAGYAVELQQVSASAVEVAGGDWTTGGVLHLTGGNNVGNDIFLSCGGGTETGLVIDNSGSQGNRIRANFSGCATAVNATAGSGNILEYPYYGSVAKGTSLVGITAPEGELIGTQTASNSAALTFTGLPVFAYYRLTCSALVPATDTVYADLQFGEGATPTWQTAGYRWTYNYQATASSGGNSNSGSGGTSAIQLGGAATNTASYGGFSLTARLDNLASTTQQKSVDFVTRLFNGSDYYEEEGIAYYTGDTNAVTGLQLLMSSGNITSGQCSLYGLNS